MMVELVDNNYLMFLKEVLVIELKDKREREREERRNIKIYN